MTQTASSSPLSRVVLLRFSSLTSPTLTNNPAVASARRRPIPTPRRIRLAHVPRYAVTRRGVVAHPLSAPRHRACAAGPHLATPHPPHCTSPRSSPDPPGFTPP